MANLDNNAVRARSGEAVAVDQGLRSYMLGVYNYMALGLALTGVVAYVVANTSLAYTIFSMQLHWVAMFATLGLVFYLSFRIAKIQASTAQALFWAYAGLNGIWLSIIFLAYTDESIFRTFLITAASFGALSLYGYTTKRNLSAMGSFLFMGLIGLIIAMVVNIFLVSSALQWAISVIGVLIFAGLTAFDTQKIKNMYYAVEGQQEAIAKTSVMGALALYLDFLNLFLFLLRFLGNSRS